MQETIVYADVGPLSNNRSRSLGNTVKLDFDEHRVEYAQLNHKTHCQVSAPVSAIENSTNEGTGIASSSCYIYYVTMYAGISLNLDSLLIQLQGKVTRKWYQFGVALGVEKEILDRYLKYLPEQSIVEILDHWLRRSEGQSWGDVARALKQINYNELAEGIESIDKMGT